MAQVDKKQERGPRTERPHPAKVERERPPEDEKFKQQIDEITAKINALMEKQREISSKIGAKVSGKEEFYRKRDEMKARLDEFQATIERLEADKQKVFDAIGNQQNKARAMKDATADMKKKIGFNTEGEIDLRIKEIEYQLHVSTLTLKEEKALIAEIGQLKGKKPMVGKYQTMAASSESYDTAGIGPLKERQTKLKEDLDAAKAAKKAQAEQYRKLTADRAAQVADVKDFVEEKEKVSAEINELMAKRTQIREDQNKNYRDFIAKQQELRAVRAEKARIERAQRQLDYERRGIERELEREDDLPLAFEIQQVEQTMTYLRKLISQGKAAEEQAAKPIVDLTKMAPKEAKGGMLMSKKDREDEFFFAPKKGPKAKQQAKPAAETEKKTEAAPKSIKHDFHSLNTFAELGLSAPLKHEDCQPLYDALSVKLAGYKQEQLDKTADWRKRKEELTVKLAHIDAKEKNGCESPAGKKAVAVEDEDAEEADE